MKYVLRFYQDEAVKSILKYINSASVKKPLVVAPTGTGKSLYIAATANAIKDPILVIQPNKELLEQNYNKYISYGNKASIYSASLKSKEIGHVTFATPMSLKGKAEYFKHVKLFILDEAHLQSNPSGVLGNFLKFFKNPKIVGLTASPVILTNSLMHGPKLDMVNRTRKSFWNQILYVTQIKEIAEKFWCKIKYESNALNDSSLEWNSSKSEFTEASMTEFYEVNKIEDLILERIKTIKEPTLIFCPSIGDATALQTKIPGSALVTSLTPVKEREKLVKLFLQGKITFMINVLIFSVGFDYPGLSYIIDATPTASIVRWYQKYGRGVRLDPSNPEKVCTFIDYANGINRFGKLEDLEFVEDPILGWGMFSKDKLLTGISISEIGSVRRKTQGEVLGSYVMTFGKYKNKKLSEIPEQYLRWMLKEFKWGMHNKELKVNIKKLLGC